MVHPQADPLDELDGEENQIAHLEHHCGTEMERRGGGGTKWDLMFPYSLRLGGYVRVVVWIEDDFITFSGNVGPRKKKSLRLEGLWSWIFQRSEPKGNDRNLLPIYTTGVYGDVICFCAWVHVSSCELCWVQSSVTVCILHTYSEEYESYGLVAATPAAEAERDERHEEGEEGEGRAPQQQGQCGDLPVWNTHTGVKSQRYRVKEGSLLLTGCRNRRGRGGKMKAAGRRPPQSRKTAPPCAYFDNHVSWG